MFPFRQLKVWQEAHALTIRMYRATATWSEQRYPDLRRQICRSAASVASNIAEGAARDSQAQFAHFLEIAIGSAAELDNHLTLAMELGALGQEAGARYANDASRLARMLITLRKRVKKPPARMKSNTYKTPDISSTPA